MTADGLTPRLVELVYNALIKCFWRKKALRTFLRNAGVSQAALATWAEDESKREFLDRLMPQIEKSTKGPVAINQMARHLAEMDTFPDLRGWEESERMIADATRARTELRNYLRAKDEQLKSERERREARQRIEKLQLHVRRSSEAREKLEERIIALQARIGEQDAGYEFQDWFYDLMDFYEIKNRRPYVHGGRQIDGSITLADTTYLVELKFTSEQAGAVDIDTFHKKVTTKADNTMGIMVSISSYSSVAIAEASGPKTPLLLLDHGHVFMALEGRMKFSSIVDRIRRHASQTGEAYLPAGRLA